VDVLVEQVGLVVEALLTAILPTKLVVVVDSLVVEEHVLLMQTMLVVVVVRLSYLTQQTLQHQLALMTVPQRLIAPQLLI
jgi:hypothetical protein